MQRALPGAEHCLLADTQTLAWQRKATFTLDVAELQQALQDLAALRLVIKLYQGELLPSCYDDWLVPLRQQLYQAVRNTIERLITLLENQRAYGRGRYRKPKRPICHHGWPKIWDR